MSDERELKYLATLPLVPTLPAAWSLGAESEAVDIRDTYLDANGALAARGWTLRRRAVTGHATLHTLKRNAQHRGPLHQREEIEVTGDTVPVPIANLVQEIGAHIVNGLRETVQLQQHRRSWPLLHSTMVVGYLALDHVSAYAHAWYELELEFSSQLDRSMIYSFAEQLQRHLATDNNLQPSDRSKEARAIAAR